MEKATRNKTEKQSQLPDLQTQLDQATNANEHMFARFTSLTRQNTDLRSQIAVLQTTLTACQDSPRGEHECFESLATQTDLLISRLMTSFFEMEKKHVALVDDFQQQLHLRDTQLHELHQLLLARDVAFQARIVELKNALQKTVILPDRPSCSSGDVVDADTQTDAFTAASPDDTSDAVVYSDVALKLMHKMGYSGGGLGSHSQERLDPVDPLIRPAGMGLGYDPASVSLETSPSSSLQSLSSIFVPESAALSKGKQPLYPEQPLQPQPPVTAPT